MYCKHLRRHHAITSMHVALRHSDKVHAMLRVWMWV